MLMIVLETLGTLVIVVLATHAIGWASALSLDDGIEVLRALWIGCVALGVTRVVWRWGKARER